MLKLHTVRWFSPLAPWRWWDP